MRKRAQQLNCRATASNPTLVIILPCFILNFNTWNQWEWKEKKTWKFIKRFLSFIARFIHQVIQRTWCHFEWAHLKFIDKKTNELTLCSHINITYFLSSKNKTMNIWTTLNGWHFVMVHKWMNENVDCKQHIVLKNSMLQQITQCFIMGNWIKK